jgi:hypothetical protein
MTEYTGVERRSGRDRRQKRLPVSKRLFFNGRRESGRRAEDRRQIMALDRYSPSLFVGIVMVLSLSLLDAMLTLTLVSRGARELNPVMAYYLSHGPHVFLSVKYGLTALSVLLIVLLKDNLPNRYCLNSSTLLHLFAAGFGSVVIWQVYLLSR